MVKLDEASSQEFDFLSRLSRSGHSIRSIKSLHKQAKKPTSRIKLDQVSTISSNYTTICPSAGLPWSPEKPVAEGDKMSHRKKKKIDEPEESQVMDAPDEDVISRAEAEVDAAQVSVHESMFLKSESGAIPRSGSLCDYIVAHEPQESRHRCDSDTFKFLSDKVIAGYRTLYTSKNKESQSFMYCVMETFGHPEDKEIKQAEKVFKSVPACVIRKEYRLVDGGDFGSLEIKLSRAMAIKAKRFMADFLLCFNEEGEQRFTTVSAGNAFMDALSKNKNKASKEDIIFKAITAAGSCKRTYECERVEKTLDEDDMKMELGFFKLVQKHYSITEQIPSYDASESSSSSNFTFLRDVPIGGHQLLYQAKNRDSKAYVYVALSLYGVSEDKELNRTETIFRTLPHVIFRKEYKVKDTGLPSCVEWKFTRYGALKAMSYLTDFLKIFDEDGKPLVKNVTAARAFMRVICLDKAKVGGCEQLTRRAMIYADQIEAVVDGDEPYEPTTDDDDDDDVNDDGGQPGVKRLRVKGIKRNASK